MSQKINADEGSPRGSARSQELLNTESFFDQINPMPQAGGIIDAEEVNAALLLVAQVRRRT